MTLDLKPQWRSTVVAFRGYNVSNGGRSAELLRHPEYGPVVKEFLLEASELCSEVTGARTDLVRRVRRGVTTRLDTFAKDIALIVALELAQIRLLEQFHQIEYRQARMAFGYSLGELSALVCGGVCRMRDILPPLLSLAGECAELGHDVTMGVVFSRGSELEMTAVERLCRTINRAGQGVMGVSARLSPNTVLVLGQGDTIDRFKVEMPALLGPHVHLRKNRERWPPLHTPILWERSVTNRAAAQSHTIPFSETAPQPPVFSLATGGISYTGGDDALSVLNRWIDHPQLLWEAVYETLSTGVSTVVHVGPEPKLIPATFRRISENVTTQVSGTSPRSLGLRAMSTIWRPWVSKWLSRRSALLRAPSIKHVILEDWLLDS